MLKILVAFISVVSLALGFIVLHINRKSKLNRYFFVMALFNSLWTLANLATAYYSSSIWVRLQYSFGALLIGSGLEWLFFLIGKKVHILRRISIYTISIFFGLTSIFGNLIIADIDVVRFGSFDGRFGMLFPLYTIFASFSLLFIVIKLFIETFRSHGVRKLQLLYVSIGALLFTLASTVPSFILPLFGKNNFSQFDVIGSFVYISLITYSIVRYRLMNIRKILAKSLLYFLLVSLITSIFAFTSFFVAETLQESGRNSRLLVFAAVSFIVVLGIDPLKRFLARITDNIFYKDRIDYQNVLRDISITISREIDLEILIASLKNALIAELKLKVADILIKSDDHYESKGAGDTKKIDSDNALIEYFNKKTEIIITDEFYRIVNDRPEDGDSDQNKHVLDELERQGIEFCAPVYLEGDLKALIILGQKQSGDIYGNDEVRFFSSLAPQVAVAIEKSLLYESIGEFNLKLQDKINKATKKLKETNLELQEANEHLKQLDTAKSEFLSIASHQLRTPISALKGYLSMLLEGDFGTVPDKQRKVIGDLFESAARLARLINIFLNVSRIESGRFKLEKTAVDINTLVDSVMKELQGQAKSKNIGLSFKPAENIRKVFCDSDKIREVILNLVDNAIKYTPKGSIAIESFEDQGFYHFVFKDTGIGVRPEEVKSLFKKFVRGAGIAQLNTQGSGLGLYIAQRVVTEHGGRIWVESKGLDKGSAFHFIIPFGDPSAVSKPSDTKSDVKTPAKTK